MPHEPMGVPVSIFSSSLSLTSGTLRNWASCHVALPVKKLPRLVGKGHVDKRLERVGKAQHRFLLVAGLLGIIKEFDKHVFNGVAIDIKEDGLKDKGRGSIGNQTAFRATVTMKRIMVDPQVQDQIDQVGNKLPSLRSFSHHTASNAI